jgi:DNA-binding beta-propeller fold protein YncE
MSTAAAQKILGTEGESYEYDANWARLPEGMAFGTTHGVIEDARGRIFVHHTGEQSVFVFEPDGSLIGAWGPEYSEGAHGMHLSVEDGEEYLYLSATKQHFVAKTTLDGHELLRIGTPPRSDIYDEDHPFVPTETTVSPDGTIYIADGYGQPWVHRYTPEGEYMDSFGGLGQGPGRLDNPHGIMLDRRGNEIRILVSDRKNKRLQYFTPEGTPDSVSPATVRFPCTTVQWNDRLYVPDLHSRVTILDGSDEVIAHLGDWPECWEREDWPNLDRSEWIDGRFSSPHDLEVDADGNIYVVEWLSEGTGKVVKLTRR